MDMSVNSLLSDDSYDSDFSPILFEQILGPDTTHNDADKIS